MDFTHRIRISLAAAIALCAGRDLLASNVAAGDPAEELMPDLKTLDPLYNPSLVLQKTARARRSCASPTASATPARGRLSCSPGPSRSSVRTRASTRAAPTSGAPEDLRGLERERRVRRPEPPSPTGSPKSPRSAASSSTPSTTTGTSRTSPSTCSPTSRPTSCSRGPRRRSASASSTATSRIPQLPGSPEFGVYPSGSNGVRLRRSRQRARGDGPVGRLRRHLQL